MSVIDRSSRERAAQWSLRVALTLTAAWISLLLLRVVGGVRLRGGVADVLQFVLVVAYVAGVPIASALAARLGNRPTHRVRIAVGLLIVWLAFLIWAATLTTRA